MKSKLKVLHVTFSTYGGGASRAAWRIHEALLKYESENLIVSQVRAIYDNTSHPSVKVGHARRSSLIRKIYERLRNIKIKNLRSSSNSDKSSFNTVAWPDTGLGKELQEAFKAGHFDILNLHWLGDETLSVEEISRLKIPIVWTLHDQWPFLGSQHYEQLSDEQIADEALNSGDQSSYQEEGRVHSNSLDKWTHSRKSKTWQSPMHIVAPSEWMHHCASQSQIMSTWPVFTIPYPIDLERWKPIDKIHARKILGLPLESSIILFGSAGSTADPRKGSDLLLKALTLLSQPNSAQGSIPNLHLVFFGFSSHKENQEYPFQTTRLGPLYDEISLAIAYSAADVFVSPSRQDNLPNTCIEAQSCGTPVVAFRTGGFSDLVEHGVTGFLAEPLDVSSLAYYIRKILSDSSTLSVMGHEARKRAELLWSQRRISASYGDIYRLAFDAHKQHP